MLYKIMIDGIECVHCEKRIQEALEKINGVTVQSVSSIDKCASISAEEEIPDELIIDAISSINSDKKYNIVKIEKLSEICCCSGKHKDRDEKERKDLMNRLKRIEGQVRGLEKMLDDGIYCTDIITQVAAVNAALNSFNKVLLANHIRTCFVDNIQKGNDEVIDELVVLLQKLMK